MTVGPHRPLVFIHVPRTGGTSLNVSLRPAFEGREFIIDHDRILTESANAIRAAWPSHPYIHGHFHLHVLDQIIGTHCDATIFSVVRDPVERLVSLYCFCMQHGKHAMPPLWQATTGKPFSYFFDYGIENYRRMFADPQCYWLSEDGSLKGAIAAIEDRYTFVGDHALLPRIAAVVADQVGRPDLALVAAPQNIGRAGAPIEEYVTPTLRRRIENTNQSDAALVSIIRGEHDGFWAPR